MTDTVVVADESTSFRFSWGLAFAGGVVAIVVTLVLLILGSGFGLLLVSPVKHTGLSAPVFLTAGAIYFLTAQAFGFAVGGHLAGRLLGPVLETRGQKELRAAAHVHGAASRRGPAVGCSRPIQEREACVYVLPVL